MEVIRLYHCCVFICLRLYLPNYIFFHLIVLLYYYFCFDSKTLQFIEGVLSFNLRFCNFNLSRSFWCVLPRAKNVRSKIKIVLKKTSDSCRYVCLLGSFQQSVQNTDNKRAKSLISNSVEPNMRRTKPSQEDLTGLFSVKYLWFQVMFYIMAWLHCHFKNLVQSQSA